MNANTAAALLLLAGAITAPAQLTPCDVAELEPVALRLTDGRHVAGWVVLVELGTPTTTRALLWTGAPVLLELRRADLATRTADQIMQRRVAIDGAKTMPTARRLSGRAPGWARTTMAMPRDLAHAAIADTALRIIDHAADPARLQNSALLTKNLYQLIDLTTETCAAMPHPDEK